MATTQTPVNEVDALTARRWIEQGEAALFDVREPDERASEWIAGSRAAPLSAFDPGAFACPGRAVLHCKGGVRSREAAGRLSAATGREVYSLIGGLDAWRAAGLPVESAGRRMPISIMRQVQIVVGSVVATASALALTVSPWFAALAGLMGLGLLVAGSTGFCGMAAALAHMPWNRAFRASAASK